MATLCNRGMRYGRLMGVALLWPASAWGHVALDTPNGGESLLEGSTFEIRWHPTVMHNTVNWDLWYSTAGAGGPWTEIALDLPLGDPTADSIHTYDWVIPSGAINSAWVRVQQDNTGIDYDDVSDASFSIVAARAGDFNRDGMVDGADLNAWEQGFSRDSGATPGDGDANLDGRVDGADLLAWQRDVRSVALVGALQAVPEPAVLALLMIASVTWSCRRLR